MKKTIKWQNWHDPFAEYDEWVNYNGQNWHDPFNGEPEEEAALPGAGKGVVRKFYNTAGGMIPEEVYGHLLKNFNLWIAHTNFRINKEIGELIAGIDGVEMFDYVTAYRFRVGIGQNFNTLNVKLDVQELLDAHQSKENEYNPKNTTLSEIALSRLSSVKDVYVKRGGYWSILVLPNGETEGSQAASKAKYDETVCIFDEVAEFVGGVVITSHDRR